MAFWLTLTILQSLFIGFLIGKCGKKKKGITSSDKGKSPSRENKAAKPTAAKLREKPSKQPDDNGYETCNDMTPEELAKVAATA